MALPGDANLDGLVDGSDFLIWNSNKFSNGATWVQGDFNGDGTVDGTDFSFWNTNKFSSTTSLVPEPVPPMAFVVIALFCWKRRSHISAPQPFGR